MATSIQNSTDVELIDIATAIGRLRFDAPPEHVRRHNRRLGRNHQKCLAVSELTLELTP